MPSQFCSSCTISSEEYLLPTEFILYHQLYYIPEAADLSRCLTLQTLRGRDVSSLWQTITRKEIRKQFTVPISNKQLYNCTKSVLHPHIQAFFKKIKIFTPKKYFLFSLLPLEKGLDFVKENGQAANAQSYFLMQKSKLPPKRFCALRFAALDF